VLHNLTEGMILVVIILFLFLGNVRGAIIVALTIPFSLLFAAICLDLKHIPANLLSLGALDFGMVVDGAVVMVENIVRHLSHARRTDARPPRRRSATPRMKCSARSFSPSPSSSPPICPSSPCRPWRAASSAHGLDGGLCAAGRADFSIVLAPVLASIFCLSKGAKEWKNPVMEWLGALSHRRHLGHSSSPVMLASAWLRFAWPSFWLSAASSAPSFCLIWTRARCGCAARCKARARTKASRRQPGAPYSALLVS
jgi:heavy metal efflux system protein